jgi:hypothetical protein
MATLRTSIIAIAALLGSSIVLSPAQGATQCSGTLAQWTATIKQLEADGAKAQAAADGNPIYISDAEYYASVLAEAERCAKSLAPLTTVAR